jgi:ADP-heptose:LPS heptosyltransferase
VVISTSCIELLRKRYPRALIDFYTEAKCAPLVRNNPHIAQIWEVDKGSGFWQAIRFYHRVGTNNYDLVVDFQHLPRCLWMMAFCRAKVRLTGPAKWYHRLLYTHFGGRSKGGYAGMLKASVLEPLGIQWDQQKPRIYLTDAERAWAGAHLASQGVTAQTPLVVVDSTHWSPTRRWPREYYAKLLRLAAEQRDDVRFYLLHGPGERDYVERLAEAAELPGRILLPPGDHAPELREMAAVVEQAALFVGNCSAPRHVAVALDVPSLTIIGSNGETAWTFPSPEHEFLFNRLPCSKCNSSTCANGTLECLRGITPEDVLAKLLDKLPPRS